MAMVDKAFKWRKCGRDLLMDERSLRLSTLALHLRLIFEIVGGLDEDQRVAGRPAPGVGWMLDEYGDAYDTARIAALIHATDVDAVELALAELEKARIVVRSETNAWGATDHEERQLDPTTKRTRRARERSGNGPGTRPEQTGPVRERSGNGASVPEVFPPRSQMFPERSADVPEPTEDRGQRTDEREQTSEAEQTPAAAAVIPIATRPSVDPATMPAARARAVRPFQDLPTSGGPVLAHALATELAALYRPEGRCFGPANPRHLELAAEVLAVAPSEGDDRRQLEQARFHEVLGFCRDFARICAEDPNQAEFWRPTMLSTRPGAGKTIAAWDMLTRSVSAWRDRRAADQLAAEAEVTRQRRAREEASRPVERMDPQRVADLAAGLLSRLGRPTEKTAEPAALPPTTPETFAEIRRRLSGEETDQ